MNIGSLNTRCQIEYKSVTQHPDYGTEVITWSLLDSTWCSIMDEVPSQSEAVKNGLDLSGNRARVRMRWRTDIDSSMRLVISRPNPIVYQIVGGPAILGNKDGLEVFVQAYSS